MNGTTSASESGGVQPQPPPLSGASAGPSAAAHEADAQFLAAGDSDSSPMAIHAPSPAPAPATPAQQYSDRMSRARAANRASILGRSPSAAALDVDIEGAPAHVLPCLTVAGRTSGGLQPSPLRPSLRSSSAGFAGSQSAVMA